MYIYSISIKNSIFPKPSSFGHKIEVGKGEEIPGKEEEESIRNNLIKGKCFIW